MPEHLSATAAAKPCRLIAGSVSMAVGTVIQCRTHERALHPQMGVRLTASAQCRIHYQTVCTGIHLHIRTMA